MQKSIICLMPLEIVLLMDYVGFLYQNRFWVDFAYQLCTKHLTKSLTDQCKDAFHLGLHLWSVFWSVYVSNFDPLDLKKHCFSIGKTMIIEKWPFEVNIDF